MTYPLPPRPGAGGLGEPLTAMAPCCISSGPRTPAKPPEPSSQPRGTLISYLLDPVSELPNMAKERNKTELTGPL